MCIRDRNKGSAHHGMGIDGDFPNLFRTAAIYVEKDFKIRKKMIL